METRSIIPLPEFDLFRHTPVQTTIEDRIESIVRPLAPLESFHVIEFVIPSTFNEYISLADTEIFEKCSISLSKSSGDVVAADCDKLSPVNYLIGSLFKSVDVQIGDKPITLSPQTYAYRAYFDALINYGKNAQTSWLTNGLFDAETVKCKSSKDGAVKELAAYFKPDSGSDQKRSKTVQLVGKLHTDLSMQHKAILGGCIVKIRLELNDSNFFLIGSDNLLTPKFKLEECYLNVVKHKISDAVVEAHSKALALSPAIYPITRREVKTVTIPVNANVAFLENIVIGKIPDKLYVAIAESEAFLGSVLLNPFNFQHFGVNYITFFVNGLQFPKFPYTPDFGSGQFIRVLNDFMKVANQHDEASKIPINRSNYTSGNVIYGFNFNPDFSDGYLKFGFVNTPRNGILRAEIRFSAPLAKAVTILLFCEYENNIFIGKDRNALTDYN